MAAWWAQSLSCDTQGNSGPAHNTFKVTIPEQNIFAMAALSELYINSSGGYGQASIQGYQIQEANGPSPEIPAGGNILWVENAVSVTFEIYCNANPAGFGFSNGANATGVFTITDWG